MKLLSKLSAALILASTALTLSTASAAPIKVAVLGGSGPGTWNLAANQLNDDSYFDFTATLLTGSSITSASALAGYDVVVMGGSGYTTSEYSAATLAAVAGFMRSGHGVVSTSWSQFGAIGQSGQAKVDADFINPVVVNGSYDYAGSGNVIMSSAAHAITNGVGNIAVGQFVETGSLDAGATSLATANGLNAIAYQDAVGRSVYLGLMYTAAAAYDNGNLRSGASDRLFEQAVAWAGTSSNQVPEPASIALLGVALAGLGFSRRRGH